MPFYPFLKKGSPTKVDKTEKMVPTYSNLSNLEDLEFCLFPFEPTQKTGGPTGAPRFSVDRLTFRSEAVAGIGKLELPPQCKPGARLQKGPTLLWGFKGKPKLGGFSLVRIAKGC